ncbi:MAG: outer rane insertion C-terminal signal domain protein [Gammaproteobacteria bacterium]|nr:outer rane insertion C-terminal signal domain protein [Gammaproteobacteria bacterium]
MLNLKLARAVKVVLATCAATCTIGSVVYAADAQDTQALKDQVRMMQQQMDALQKKIDSIASKPAKPEAQGPAVAKKEEAPAEPKFDKFLKGFYGTLDVSFDDATKGIRGLTAYAYPGSGTAPYVSAGPKGTQIVGSVGWLGDLSTNKSVLGYRGSHKIAGSNVEFIYQIETQPAITSAPGTSTSWTAQSNVTKAGIGYGDTFVGLSNTTYGKLKIGTTYSPYKKSTDRMNPFSGMLGDYAVVMGNSGGDNRVEFGTRLDHSIWFESPKYFNMVSFDLLVSPGANRTYDNLIQSAGSPDCSGGNMPGSGNLPLGCDDGGFGTAYSADLKFETGGFYSTVAWELHHHVNRNSDGIGANAPGYGNLAGLGNGVSPLLDWNTYNLYAAEYPTVITAGNGFSPPYLADIGDEWAIKAGLQYTFDFGLSVSGIYEWMKRDLPPALEFQNERTRMGTWFAATYDLTAKDNLSIGWAHAGATPGDPGGQHNYNPNNTQNQANMYTIALKHRFDKNFYVYIDAADTVNNGNAHYDIGAGGRGVTTDCHDGTNTVFNDYSSAGPTTWGGCHPIGVSVGMNYKF